MIQLTNIDIPQTEAYDSGNPNKQHENLCYVILQIFSEGKNQNLTLEGLFWGETLGFLKDIAYKGTWQDYGSYRQSVDHRLTEDQYIEE